MIVLGKSRGRCLRFVAHSAREGLLLRLIRAISPSSLTSLILSIALTFIPETQEFWYEHTQIIERYWKAQ